jgi:hypothetical protein
MAHQVERFLEQWNDLEFRLRLGIVDQTDVDPTRRNPFDDVVRQPLDDGESCSRQLSLKALDQLQWQLAGNARWQPDGDPTDRLVAAGPEILARMGHQLQDRYAVIK